MRVRAKFRCWSLTWFDQAGSSRQVKLSAVTDDGNPENKAFWNATPSGTIDMLVSNPQALSLFEPGKTYYVTFYDASEPGLE